ncbi:MAG: tRNA pseudouridine(55) synthase TruB, partial [Gemmatimonadales bacterium]|nr:tRNA pseudouridine(55) synthase TruB [Gemmatimonadales bacterium]
MLLDKPAGLTSHDVVQRVRRNYRERAVGHTGTLDPFATGLLVVLLGRATRLARFVEGQPKTYLAVARLGIRTDTDDATGRELPALAPGGAVDEAAVDDALESLRGPQSQRPPAFSAKHVDGERSYRIARRGELLDLPPVDVTVHRLELIGVNGDLVTFRTTVSAGTYVRAIARDLGERLGTGAHLVALRREAIGELQVTDAVAVDALMPETPVLPALAVLRHLAVCEVDAAGAAAVAHGRPLPASEG